MRKTRTFRYFVPCLVLLKAIVLPPKVVATTLIQTAFFNADFLVAITFRVYLLIFKIRLTCDCRQPYYPFWICLNLTWVGVHIAALSHPLCPVNCYHLFDIGRTGTDTIGRMIGTVSTLVGFVEFAMFKHFSIGKVRIGKIVRKRLCLVASRGSVIVV